MIIGSNPGPTPKKLDSPDGPQNGWKWWAGEGHGHVDHLITENQGGMDIQKTFKQHFEKYVKSQLEKDDIFSSEMKSIFH